MKLLLLLTLTWAALAADPKPITETEALAAKVKALEQDAKFAKLEAAILREQLARTEITNLVADKEAAYAEACKGAGLPVDVKVCGVDFKTHKIVDLGNISSKN